MKALDGVRILDLTQKLTGSLATMYLSSYGAEVVKIEPPGGDPARHWAPKRDGESIYFHYLNSGKKSVVLDLETEEGQESLRNLIPAYDVLCLDGTPSSRKAMRLDYESVRSCREDIIYAVCSCFGDEGPDADRPGSSLVAQAKGVAMDMTGMPGEEPVHLAPSVAEHYAAAYYASGIVMALLDRAKRGIGQKLDISLLDAVFSCIEAAPAAYSTVGEVQRRKGNDDPTCAPYDTYEARDGYVAIGVATQSQWLKFCDAMGFDDFKENPNYLDPKKRLADYYVDLKPALAARLKTMSKMEVEARCRSLGVPCGAVLRVDEVTKMANTVENGYVTTVKSDLFGEIVYPSVPFAMDVTPAADFFDAAALGADTKEIIGAVQKNRTGKKADAVQEKGRAFDGLKVLDYTHAYAGPFCTQILGDFGASVIKVERVDGGDQSRGWAPFKNDYSGYYASFNRGKQSLALDIKSEEGQEILRRLTMEADVVVSNFKAGTLDRYGLGYAQMKKARPDLIYATISGFGSKGEFSKYAAYDNVIQAASGIMDVNGFPDGAPVKIGPAVGDSYSGLLLLAGLAIALYHRRRTGQGQEVSVSMLGALYGLLEYPVLEYTACGKVLSRQGNRSLYHAPEDVYPTAEEYVAVSVKNDAQWQVFREKLDLEDKEAWRTAAGRLADVNALTEAVKARLAGCTAAEVEESFRGTDVAAAKVVCIAEAVKDPQLLARNMVIKVDDPVLGALQLVGDPIRLSANQQITEIPSPTLGADTDAVLEAIGYSRDVIDALRKKQVIV